ncbi:hypothetical protein XA68_11952 [Ophiocordyceps unilateralis]|uniref:Uncharacterized protein n=1 Tax=Ophiocordyceps unilateralis TaxID=268505 RepID=A0A2A9PFV7_OPHUN|nr:hypothetical protein XA68_11952 [Ophiocordyceps unilateralis]
MTQPCRNGLGDGRARACCPRQSHAITESTYVGTAEGVGDEDEEKATERETQIFWKRMGGQSRNKRGTPENSPALVRGVKDESADVPAAWGSPTPQTWDFQGSKYLVRGEDLTSYPRNESSFLVPWPAMEESWKRHEKSETDQELRKGQMATSELSREPCQGLMRKRGDGQRAPAYFPLGQHEACA